MTQCHNLNKLITQQNINGTMIIDVRYIQVHTNKCKINEMSIADSVVYVAFFLSILHYTRSKSAVNISLVKARFSQC